MWRSKAASLTACFRRWSLMLAQTIRRDLADLVERGLLMKIGEKRATYYILK